MSTKILTNSSHESSGSLGQGVDQEKQRKAHWHGTERLLVQLDKEASLPTSSPKITIPSSPTLSDVESGSLVESPTSPKSPRPLTDRVSTTLDKLSNSGKDVGKVFTSVIPNSEITTDSGSSPSGIISKGREEVAEIRKAHAISHAQDPALETIFDLENHLTHLIAESSPEETDASLKTQGFDVAFKDGDLTLWKDGYHRPRVFTDNNNFKGQMFLNNLKKLPDDSRATMKDLNESINKLCTSIDTDKGAIFCGMDEGILVYLAPQSHPICAHMCDVLSITEFWDKSKEIDGVDESGQQVKIKPYDVSRQYGWGYYLDQNKYKLGHDWVKQVKNEYIQELETLLKKTDLEAGEREKITSALETLRQKPVSILKKELVTDKEARTELELQLETLIKIGKDFPQFAKKELHDTLQTMQKTVHVFAKHKDVIARSAVKQPISVWGVSKSELLESHPLVSLPKKLNALKKELSALDQDLDLDIAELDPDTASEFLEKHRDVHFDRNVGASATAYPTVTDAIESNKQFKAKTIGKLKELQTKLAEKYPDDSRANKIIEDCSKLIDQISKMYSEIQFYTVGSTGDKGEMPVSGFGFKEPLAREAMSENYTRDLTAKKDEYTAHKGEKAEADKQNEALKKKLTALTEQQKSLTEPSEKAQMEQEIAKCKTDQEVCQATISALQKKISHFESVMLTRDMIEECHKRSIPCFVHYGPS
jgi:hypothetical protein